MPNLQMPIGSWRSRVEPVFLDLEDVLRLHEQSIRLYGGQAGLRDRGLLESAVLAVQQTFDGELLYRDLAAVAAALWHGIVQNHPFVDGNKRTGLRAADTFLLINGLDLAISVDEAVEWTLALATLGPPTSRTCRSDSDPSQTYPLTGMHGLEARVTTFE